MIEEGDTNTLKQLEHISQEVEKLTESSDAPLVAVDALDVAISFRNTSAIGWH